MNRKTWATIYIFLLLVNIVSSIASVRSNNALGAFASGAGFGLCAMRLLWNKEISDSKDKP